LDLSIPFLKKVEKILTTFAQGEKRGGGAALDTQHRLLKWGYLVVK
jgi:hypothetical protein